jgi:hypothetical protein
MEAEKCTKNKRHFANTSLHASKGGNHDNIRKERLHAVTTIWFTSMIIPTLLVQLKSNWDGISGEPDDKRRIFGTLKGFYGKITKDTGLQLEATNANESYQLTTPQPATTTAARVTGHTPHDASRTRRNTTGVRCIRTPLRISRMIFRNP